MKIIDDPDLRERVRVFKDREEAGKKLAEFLKNKLKERENLVVLAIPRGGVPIGCIVARELGAELDLVIVKKIPVPWDPEAGFGAITPDGDIFVDDRIIAYLGLDKKTIRQLADEVLSEIRRREKAFLGDRSRVSLEHKSVVLVDDGLATGYTMLAAVKYAKKRNPKNIFIATPTASGGALSRLAKHVDTIFCLNVRAGIPYFAVADAYVYWTDLTDEDVIEYLRKFGYV